MLTDTYQEPVNSRSCPRLSHCWGVLNGRKAALSTTVFLLGIANPLECAVPGSVVGLSCLGAWTLLTDLPVADGDGRREEETWTSSLTTYDLWELLGPRLPWCPLPTVSPPRLSSGPSWSQGFRCSAQDGSWRPWWSPTTGILGKCCSWQMRSSLASPLVLTHIGHGFGKSPWSSWI